jgi:prepilin signal peptidase PulO-like enzyme (type II secretory pathway)
MFSADTAHWIIVLWLAVLGGAIGSFLNVVIYRLPAGISLVHPPSHCPTCKHGIRWFDNVPVFGWIMLRGRCRDCGSPISIRYPAVEAFAAAMFGIVAAIELWQSAEPPADSPPLWAGYAYHLILLCTLLCAALIEADRNRPPWRLYFPAFVVGLGMPLFWSTLRPPATCWTVPTWASGAVDALAGLAAGAFLGIVGGTGHRACVVGVPSASPRTENSLPSNAPQSRGILFGLILVGVMLGWQSVTLLGVATIVVYVVLQLFGRVWHGLRVPPSVLLFIATFAGILMWAHLASLWQP